METRNQNKLSVSKNIAWSSVGSFVYFFSQWLLTIAVTRIAGYSEAGIFSLGMSLSNMFYCVAIYGVRNYQVSDIKDKYSAKTYIISRYITCLISFFVFILFVVINQYNIHTFIAITLYMVFKLTEALVDVYHGIDQKCWRMDIVGKSFIMRSGITFLSFVVSLYFTKSLSLSILLMGIGSLLVVLLYDKKRSLQLIMSTNEACDINKVKALLIECIPLVIYLFLSTAIGSIPRFFLEKYYGNEILGIFASVATPAVIVQVASSYVFNPMITLFAEKLEQKEQSGFLKLFFKCLLGIGIISIIALLGAALLKDWGLSLLFGESILGYTYLFVPVIITTILTALVWFECSILTVYRELKMLMYVNAFIFILCVTLSIICVSKNGMMGVNKVLIISLGAEAIVLFLFILKYTKDYFTTN